MFNSGQKVSLGGFQFLLVELFRIEHSSLSKNGAISGESTHYSKCREQKKKKKKMKERKKEKKSQSWISYFGTFQYFSTLSIHHK